MMHRNQLETQKIISATLAKRMLFGTILAFAVISLFVFRVPHPRPEWGSLWMIRPLIVTPLAGAMCGACYHMIHFLLCQHGKRKILAITLGILVYFIGLWMGIVLGLAGTLWH